jgi:protein ImuB
MLWIACRFQTPVHFTAEQWALQFTPMVCRGDWPEHLLLEVQGSLRLWGGLDQLCQTVVRSYQSWGQSIDLALGHTPRAADWTARWRSQQGHAQPCLQPLASLEPLPLSCIPQAQSHLAVLSRMGLYQLGSLLKLPRAGLNKRFGPQLLQAIDAALGQRLDPRQAIVPPARFSQSLELPITSAHHISQGLLLQASEKLLVHATAWLRAQQAGSRCFVFSFQTGSRQTAPSGLQLAVELAQPTADLVQVLRCLQIQLEQHRFETIIESICLQIDQVESHQPLSVDFFSGPSQHNEQLQDLLSRLSQRLGPDQILVPRLQDSHAPEQACHWQPWQTLASRPGRPGKPGSSHPFNTPEASGWRGPGQPARPLWLVDPPQALRHQGHRPCLGQPLQLKAGPERIETHWWEQPIQRDYFIAQTHDQQLVWIFRNPDHQWFLHGYFG